MTDYKVFETERLIIRPTVIEDAAFIFELFNSPKWLKFIGNRNINSVALAEGYIKDRMTLQLERLGYSTYTLIRKSDKAKIGTCGLYDREGLEGIDIGFAFLPAFEGQGYGFESAKRIKEAAFHEFGLDVINAITDKENIASQKLLEKLGLKLIGPTKLSDEREEVLFYSLKQGG